MDQNELCAFVTEEARGLLINVAESRSQTLERFIVRLQERCNAMRKREYEERLPKASQDVQDAAKRGYTI